MYAAWKYAWVCRALTFTIIEKSLDKKTAFSEDITWNYARVVEKTREEINIEGFDFSGNRSMSRILLSEIPTNPPWRISGSSGRSS